MVTTQSIGKVLFTRTQQEILGLLFGNTGKSYYLNELVRLAGVGKGSVKRELDRLVAAEILTLSPIGNQNHYQANAECPVFDELRSLVRKTFGLAHVLEEALGPMSDKISYAFVYGSLARGKEKSESDVDLMIVGNDLDYADVMDHLLPVEARLHRTINPTLLSPGEFQARLTDKKAFLTRVMAQERITVMGSLDAIQ